MSETPLPPEPTPLLIKSSKVSIRYKSRLCINGNEMNIQFLTFLPVKLLISSTIITPTVIICNITPYLLRRVRSGPYRKIYYKSTKQFKP